MLEIDMVISRKDSVYYRNPTFWKPDYERSEKITQQRYKELEKMREFVDYKGCYMEFISSELDDPYRINCKRCSNCEGKKFFNNGVDRENLLEATKFLKSDYLIIKPRKKWADGTNMPKELLNEEGRVLCNYGDAGWGKYVKEDKYRNEYFRDELVDVTVDLIINTWNIANKLNYVVSIPSLRRPRLVKSFADRVSKN
jgi:ATP-dependent DNA helicase RecQ